MGVIVNTLVIVVSAFIGLQIRSGIPARMHERTMQGVGLCVLGIGIAGVIQGSETVVTILSIVIGTFIGESIDIDRRVVEGVDYLENRFAKGNRGPNNLAQGFIGATMLFCIGSLSIVGSLEAGLTGDNTMLYTKSILDGITAILLASSLGGGVVLGAIPVFFLQGALVLLASLLQPFLSAEVITEVICVGSILLVGLSLNILGVTKLKIMNFTPAIFLPVLLMLFF